MLQLLIANDAPFVKADQEHPTRLQAPLFPNARRRQIQHAGFGCHHQLVIVGKGIAEGAQAVAVQHGAHILAVSRQHHRRPVPRLHHRRVVLVKILLLLGHRFVLIPRFGDHHQHRVGQFPPGHHQQLQGVVKAGGVAGLRVANGRQLADVIAVKGRGELRLPGAHPVDIAAQRIDFAVVRQAAVGMRQFPMPQRIRAETGMHQRKGGHQRGIVQIQVKRRQLVRHQQPLINHRVGAQTANVKEVGVIIADAGGGQAVFNNLANHKQLALKGGAALDAGQNVGATPPDKELPDGRADGAGVPSDGGVVQRNIAPAQEVQTFGGNHILNVGDGGAAGIRILRQKDHTHPVFPLRRQGNALGAGRLAKESVRHLQQNAGAVPGVRVGAGRPPMPQVDEHLQRFGDDGMGLFALDIGDHADAAGVVLLLDGVQAGLGQFFERIHSGTPMAGRKDPKIAGKRRRAGVGGRQTGLCNISQTTGIARQSRPAYTGTAIKTDRRRAEPIGTGRCRPLQSRSPAHLTAPAGANRNPTAAV